MIGELFTRLAQAVILSLAIERLIEYFLGWPLERYAPEVDRGLLRYAGLLAGGAASWLARMNIFTPEAMPETVGLVITALLIGAGSEMIHQVVKSPQVPTRGE